MRLQRLFSVLLPAVLLLSISMLIVGCYTQFATTNSIERISSPSEVDVEELVENGSSVTINNYYDGYYDSYYLHFLRPMIYGFAGVWGWYDPFWGYPLWYTPVFAPVAYYDWRWNAYFPPAWGSTVASTAPVGTRRTGIGRTRTIGIENPIFPANSSLRYGSSQESTVAPSSRRRRDGTTTTVPADASRRNSRTRTPETKYNRASQEQRGGYSTPSRRQSSGVRRLPSYSAPSQRSSPPSFAPSRSAGSSSGSSSSGSSGRRQR